MSSVEEGTRQADLIGRDGIRLRADIVGSPSAPPVVLLHGGGQTRHSWGTTARALADRGWQAYSVDLRGHGESQWPENGDYRLEAFSNDVFHIASSFDAPPVLIGASLGGIASLLAVGEHADGVATALAMVDVAPRIERGGAQRITNFMTDRLDDGYGSLEEVADAIAAYNPHRPRPTDLSGLQKNLRRRPDGRWTWHWDPRFISRDMEADLPRQSDFADANRLESAARQVKVPTLLVRGRVSDLLSEDGAKELLGLIPHAEFARVEGAGHMVAGDRNDLFNDAIVSFIDRHRP